MKQIVTLAIVLSRTNYGEADRIVTLLTPEQGKLRLMARGVRKIKSKLAGGIELFSITSVTYIPGKREIGTLISSRLDCHYGNIVKDIERVQLGYDLIKQLNKATEDHPEAEYFQLLQQAFAALNDHAIELELIRCWFEAQLLRLAGHSPNLLTDTTGAKLVSDQTYNFDLDTMSFAPHARGTFTANHIKFMRLLFDRHAPRDLQKITSLSKLLKSLTPLLGAMSQQHHY